MSGALKCEVHQNSSVGLLKHRLLGHLQSVWVCRSNIGPKPAFLARSQVVLLLALEHSLKITALFPSTETGHLPLFRGFPGGSDTKESTCNVGDPDSIPGSGKSPGGGNGNPLQRSLAGYSPGGHKRVGYDQACTHTHTHRCAVWPIQPNAAHHGSSHMVLMMLPVLSSYSKSSPTSSVRLFPPTLIKKTLGLSSWNAEYTKTVE